MDPCAREEAAGRDDDVVEDSLADGTGESRLLPLKDPPIAAAEDIEALRGRAYLHIAGALSRGALKLARILPARLVTGRVGAAYRHSLELEAARAPGRRGRREGKRIKVWRAVPEARSGRS